MATISERLRRRAETYNTGSPVNPQAIGTLGYYSVHDAKFDTEAADTIDALVAALEAARGLDSLAHELNDCRKDEYDDLAKQVEAIQEQIDAALALTQPKE